MEAGAGGDRGKAQRRSHSAAQAVLAGSGCWGSCLGATAALVCAAAGLYAAVPPAARPARTNSAAGPACLPPSTCLPAPQVGKMHFGYILGWMVVGAMLIW